MRLGHLRAAAARREVNREAGSCFGRGGEGQLSPPQEAERRAGGRAGGLGAAALGGTAGALGGCWARGGGGLGSEAEREAHRRPPRGAEPLGGGEQAEPSGESDSGKARRAPESRKERERGAHPAFRQNARRSPSPAARGARPTRSTRRDGAGRVFCVSRVGGSAAHLSPPGSRSARSARARRGRGGAPPVATRWRRAPCS